MKDDEKFKSIANDPPALNQNGQATVLFWAKEWGDSVLLGVYCPAWDQKCAVYYEGALTYKFGQPTHWAEPDNTPNPMLGNFMLEL